MRDPFCVLNNLNHNAKKADYKFKKLYRNLYNAEFYKLAYFEIGSKPGNMTSGTDNLTIDGMSLKRINKLIEKIKSGKYNPTPVRRVYIDKNGSKKKRPLGIPSVDDKLVQQVIKYQLEAIYEPNFKDSSHGFRPKRSCHSALAQIEKQFIGTKWFIEGDIKSFFDEIDHKILIKILRKRIHDETLLGIINKFLKAGYIEYVRNYKTYSGTPQGGILSPILANIYLNELDEFMEELTKEFNKGFPKSKTRHPQYRLHDTRVTRLKKKIKQAKENGEMDLASQLTEELKLEIKEREKYPYYSPMCDKFKTLKYVRYADDFLIGIIGSKADALLLKEQISNFLSQELKLNLSQEKTLITHSSKFARFLGYDVVINRSNDFTVRNGIKRRNHNMKVKFYVPHELWRNKLIELRALDIINKKGCKGIWKPKHRPELAFLDDLEILKKYNDEIRGIYNYYKYANNSTVLQKFYYIMEYSLYKTFANKYKSSIGKIKNKYCKNRVFTVSYKNKKGDTKYCYLYNQGFKTQPFPSKPEANAYEMDTLPNAEYSYTRTSLIDRLSANKCELCGITSVDLYMHHVRKLADLKNKSFWEKMMISRARKTIAVCFDCHNNIHEDFRKTLIEENRNKKNSKK